MADSEPTMFVSGPGRELSAIQEAIATLGLSLLRLLNDVTAKLDKRDLPGAMIALSGMTTALGNFSNQMDDESRANMVLSLRDCATRIERCEFVAHEGSA